MIQHRVYTSFSYLCVSVTWHIGTSWLTLTDWTPRSTWRPPPAAGTWQEMCVQSWGRWSSGGNISCQSRVQCVSSLAFVKLLSVSYVIYCASAVESTPSWSSGDWLTTRWTPRVGPHLWVPHPPLIFMCWQTLPPAWCPCSPRHPRSTNTHTQIIDMCTCHYWFIKHLGCLLFDHVHFHFLSWGWVFLFLAVT